MEYTYKFDRLNTRQIQMLYGAAGDYWEILDEICERYGVEHMWELKSSEFSNIFDEVRALAAIAPLRYKDL